MNLRKKLQTNYVPLSIFWIQDVYPGFENFPFRIRNYFIPDAIYEKGDEKLKLLFFLLFYGFRRKFNGQKDESSRIQGVKKHRIRITGPYE
jgi:hypothetical protein